MPRCTRGKLQPLAHGSARGPAEAAAIVGYADERCRRRNGIDTRAHTDENSADPYRAQKAAVRGAAAVRRAARRAPAAARAARLHARIRILRDGVRRSEPVSAAQGAGARSASGARQRAYARRRSSLAVVPGGSREARLEPRHHVHGSAARAVERRHAPLPAADVRAVRDRRHGRRRRAAGDRRGDRGNRQRAVRADDAARRRGAGADGA